MKAYESSLRVSNQFSVQTDSDLAKRFSNQYSHEGNTDLMILKIRQSEFFYQYFRTLCLEYLEWDWSNPEENIPRKVWVKISETLYPMGSGEINIPQLADILLMPNSDWYIKENFTYAGKTWKSALIKVLKILNDLGFYIPNIFDWTIAKSKYSLSLSKTSW